MRRFLPLLLLLALCAPTRANNVDANSFQIRSHFVGEPVTRFLRLESDAREELEICRERAVGSVCTHLINAVDRGARAEISTRAPMDFLDPDAPRDSVDFVLDGGKVVKMTMLVSDVADVLKQFGQPSSKSTAPARNKAGQKWEDHISVWSAADVYVSLYEDGNPSLEDKRPTLTIETPAEHARDVAAAAPRPTPRP